MDTAGGQKTIGADEIREYTSKTFVVPARQKGQKRFSIKVGDVVRNLKLYRSVPAVCSALKTAEFRRANRVRIVDATGPKSGLSTTVVFTYEFVDLEPLTQPSSDGWSQLRGALKEIFTGLGGGEAYLRGERSNFYTPGERE